MALNQFNWDVSSGLQQGIESGGQGLAAGIEHAGANLRKMKAYRAMAVDALGMDPDQVDKMNLGELEGKFQAVAVSNAQQEHEAKMKDIMAQATEREQQAAEADAWSKIGPELSTWTANNPGKQPDASTILSIMSHAGPIAPRVQGAMMSKLIPQIMNGDAGNMQFTEDPVSGFRFATKGKIVQPSGVNPEKVKTASELQPMHDEENNLIGWTQTDVRGHSTFHAFKGGNKMPPAKDEQGNIISGFYVSPEGKIVDARTGIEKLTGPKTPAKSETPPAAAAPTGDRAVIQDKTGKKFTVPKSQLSDALKQGYSEVK